MLIKSMPTVLCPNCVKQGGLKIHMKLQAYPLSPFRDLRFSAKLVPVLACGLCRWTVDGWLDGTEAVFPDPHVPAPKLREVAQRERRFRRDAGNPGGNNGGNP
jgi:hypothetical protein